MFKLKTSDVLASEIAGLINSKLTGEDFLVIHPSSKTNFLDNSFIYLLEEENVPYERLRRYRNVLILTSKPIAHNNVHCSFILSNNPKVDFIKVINEFYIEFDPVSVASSAKIHSDAEIGLNVSIGENCIIGPDVSIGNNTKILNNVVITARVDIGKNCIIKDNSTIGSEGYEFVTDEKGDQIHYPHIGKIRIGNNVWIGANTSIESASLDDTVIGDFVKIDDLVQIGYNSIIGDHCMITAGVIVNRFVKIGERCLIAPNASIRDKVEIGKNVTVGTGTVVVKDLENDSVYIGNPAHLLKLKEESK